MLWIWKANSIIDWDYGKTRYSKPGKQGWKVQNNGVRVCKAWQDHGTPECAQQVWLPLIKGKKMRMKEQEEPCHAPTSLWRQR
jgi:hypothetical protein